MVRGTRFPRAMGQGRHARWLCEAVIAWESKLKARAAAYPPPALPPEYAEPLLLDLDFDLDLSVLPEFSFSI